MPTILPNASPSSPAVDPELGPQPTPPFPESDAIGIGTLRITAPRPEVARFWITCEWSTAERVQWLYTGGGTAGYPGGPFTLLGETVSIYISNLLDGDGDPHSFHLGRRGEVASYRIDPGETPALAHASDWTSGALTFSRLQLDPEAWPAGPLPTPKESYERPLGGDPTTVVLAGSFEWTCGPQPRGLPTAGPPESPGPSIRTLNLPHATLTVSPQSRLGVPGCGAEWGTGGVISGGTSCGPSFELLPDASVIGARLGGELRFTLPKGFHFLAWRYEYVDQTVAALYRHAEPLGLVVAGRDEATTTESVTVDAPPSGDWAIRFTFAATNGDVIVSGMPDYFRMAVR